MKTVTSQSRRMTLDHEAQLPGEDEAATATRWLERGLVHYPCAFDLALAAGIYKALPAALSRNPLGPPLFGCPAYQTSNVP